MELLTRLMWFENVTFISITYTKMCLWPLAGGWTAFWTLDAGRWTLQRTPQRMLAEDAGASKDDAEIKKRTEHTGRWTLNRR